MTEDQVIDKTSVEQWAVGSDGRILPPTMRIPLDPVDIVEAGKLPENEGILDRNPKAVFEMNIDGMPIHDAVVTVTLRPVVGGHSHLTKGGRLGRQNNDASSL